MNLSRLFASNILWRGTYLISSLLVTVLLARYLAAYTTGWLFYFISWLSFFLLIASFSMESSITYFVSAGQISDQKMQSFALCWTLMITSLTIVAGLLFFQQASEFVSQTMLVKFTVFFITGNLLITFFNSLFYAKQQYMLPNIVFISFNLFIAALLLYGINGGAIEMMGHRFLEIYFFTYFLQGIITAMLYVIVSKDHLSFALPSAAMMKKIVVYSSMAFFANMFFYLVTRIDYWLLDYYDTSRSLLGNYIQASRLVQLFQLFPAILASSIFPLAAAGYSTKIKDGIVKLSRIIVLCYLILIVVIAVTGKWVFPFIFGESFQTMYHAFLFLTPGLLALSVLSLMAAYFAAINKIKWNVMSSLAGLLVIVIGDFFLIKKFGVYGAASMSSVGYILCFTVAYYFFNKETRYSIKDLVWFRKEDVLFLSNLVKNLKHSYGKSVNKNA
jgi:O-antigen/teichoic acid export membrane protein